MNNITYHQDEAINQGSLLALYNNAGWIAYTVKPNELERAIKNSHYVMIAKDNDKLVGLIRAVRDGMTIIYIQDILVHTDYKRKKIGTTLMLKMLERFKDVRQKVLLTEDNKETRSFYESLGFESCDKDHLVSFVKI